MIDEHPKVRNKKLLCSCNFQYGIPEKEITFIKDQRNARKMIIGHVDVSHSAVQRERLSHIRKSRDESEQSSRPEVACCSNSLLTSTRLRRRSIVSALPDSESDGESDEVGIQYCPGEVVGGKNYHKKAFSITEESCILADRRMTSLRQQSDQLLSVVGPENIAASASTVYRHREKMRMKALQRSETLEASSTAIQLCYDGKIIDKIDRYVFVAQFVNVNDAKTEQVVGVKSFGKDQSVTAEALFNAISDVCSGILHNTYSVMADATALNTGKISGVSKRLPRLCQDYCWPWDS